MKDKHILKNTLFKNSALSLIACLVASVPLSAAEELVYSESFDNPTGEDVPLTNFGWNVEGEPTNFPEVDEEITLAWNSVSKADNFDPLFDPDAVPGAIFTLESFESAEVSRLLYTDLTIDRPDRELGTVVFWTSTFNLALNYDLHIAVRVGGNWYASQEEVAGADWLANDEWYEIYYDAQNNQGWLLLEQNANGGYDVTADQFDDLPAGDITAAGVLGYRDSTVWAPQLPRWGGFRIDNFEVYTVDGEGGQAGIWDDVSATDGWKSTEIGWIHDGLYPLVFSLQTGSWLFVYGGNRSTSYLFYDYSDDAWKLSNDQLGGWVWSYATGQYENFLN